MSSLPPLLFTSAGPVATPPATLRSNLITIVAAEVPDYTANLPGSLIEDMSSTAVGALTTVDQWRVDAVNNVSPYAANPYILAQQGQQYGVPQGQAANGSVYVVFTGSAGYVIPPGFLVSDGTNQYAIRDGGVVATGGTSPSLYAVATNSGTFAIPAGSVNQVVTAVPSPYTLTVTNPLAGVPAQDAQTVEDYRAQVLQASQSTISGWQTYLKTLLRAVPGVAARLVSVIPNSTNWEVIVGGGDSYEVAAAIYAGVSNIGLLVGSATSPRNITVTLYDAPDTYTIKFVNPPQQEVTVDVTWNTTLSGFTASNAVNQLIIAAVLSYINSIYVGQPINLLVMDKVVQDAISSVLSADNLTTLTYVVKYSGVTQSPTAGTSIIPAPDNETALYSSATDITSVQG